MTIKKKPTLKQIEVSMQESEQQGLMTSRLDPETGDRLYRLTDAGRARIESMLRPKPAH